MAKAGSQPGILPRRLKAPLPRLKLGGFHLNSAQQLPPPSALTLRRVQRRAGSAVSRQCRCVARLAGHGLQVCDPRRLAPLTGTEAPKAAFRRM